MVWSFTEACEFLRSPLSQWKKMQASTVLNFEFVNATRNQGGCSTVHIARDKEFNVLSAIKVVQLKSLTKEEHFKKEARISNILTGMPNIIQVKNSFIESDHGFIVMELAECDLHDKFVGRPIQQKLLKQIFLQICTGVLSCHSKGIIHLDIKPENILIDANGVAKLCDFGSAVEIHNAANYFQTCSEIGSELYVAPEVRKTPMTIGFSADMFSLGVLLFVLVCGAYPYRGKTEEEILKSYHNDDICFDALENAKITPVGKNLIRLLLKPTPKYRLTIAQTINHPWFTENEM